MHKLQLTKPFHPHPQFKVIRVGCYCNFYLLHTFEDSSGRGPKDGSKATPNFSPVAKVPVRERDDS